MGTSLKPLFQSGAAAFYFCQTLQSYHFFVTLQNLFLHFLVIFGKILQLCAVKISFFILSRWIISPRGMVLASLTAMDGRFHEQHNILIFNLLKITL